MVRGDADDESRSDVAVSPLRVDFAGSWLDVPRLARQGGYVVNCTIQPLVSLTDWPYEIGGGLGGSAAKLILEGKDGVAKELSTGVGWQDPAVILETGLCVWESGQEPVLELRADSSWLRGTMLLWWTGRPHNTPDLVDMHRDYEGISEASRIARDAVHRRELAQLAQAVRLAYITQLDEGMDPLPEMDAALSMKYLGGGHGGYALYLFGDSQARDAACVENTKIVEPYESGS